MWAQPVVGCGVRIESWKGGLRLHTAVQTRASAPTGSNTGEETIGKACLIPLAICRAISGGDEPTIRDLTEFYLSRDPTNPDTISLYRRNLLYIPELRWFLVVPPGKAKLADIDHFDKVRVNHDNIMEALTEDDGTTTAEGEESNISEVEVRAIFDEGLEDFFEDQLKQVVRVL